MPQIYRSETYELRRRSVMNSIFFTRSEGLGFTSKRRSDSGAPRVRNFRFLARSCEVLRNPNTLKSLCVNRFRGTVTQEVADRRIENQMSTHFQHIAIKIRNCREIPKAHWVEVPMFSRICQSAKIADSPIRCVSNSVFL